MQLEWAIIRIFLSLLIISVSSPIAIAEGNKYKDWSDKPAPKDWNNDAYSPTGYPNYGEGFNPDGSKKKPTSGKDTEQPNYDAYLDPHHPLKNPEGPPREWVYEQEPVDADYDGKPDVDENGKPVTKDKEVTVDEDGDGKPDVDKNGNLIKKKVPVKPADGGPSVQKSSADVDWGERYYDAQFDQPLIVTNKCTTPQPVTITVNDLPYLTFPSSNIEVQPGETTVTGKVKLPPEPDPPINLGMPGAPGWGHVDFGPIFIPPGQFPPPQLHQPHFAQVEGSIEVWHPWAPAGSNECLPNLVTYTVTGHIHFRPPPPDGGGGPEKLATPHVCEVYWNIGEPPPQYKGEDCTEIFNELAKRFRNDVLPSYVMNAPNEWGWLPGESDIENMSTKDLLNIKTRAESVMGARFEFVPVESAVETLTRSGNSSATLSPPPSSRQIPAEFDATSKSAQPARSTSTQKRPTTGPVIDSNKR